MSTETSQTTRSEVSNDDETRVRFSFCGVPKDGTLDSRSIETVDGGPTTILRVECESGTYRVPAIDATILQE